MDELYLSLLKEASLDKEFAKRVLNTKLEVIGVKTPILKKIAKENLNYKFNDISTIQIKYTTFLLIFLLILIISYKVKRLFAVLEIAEKFKQPPFGKDDCLDYLLVYLFMSL